MSRATICGDLWICRHDHRPHGELLVNVKEKHGETISFWWAMAIKKQSESASFMNHGQKDEVRWQKRDIQFLQKNTWIFGRITVCYRKLTIQSKSPEASHSFGGDHRCSPNLSAGSSSGALLQAPFHLTLLLGEAATNGVSQVWFKMNPVQGLQLPRILYLQWFQWLICGAPYFHPS